MAYTDKTLTCVDCQTQFTFSARDQEFHASKGFTNEPKRCPSCRQARRQQRGDTPAGTATAKGPAPVYAGPRAQGRPAASGDRGGRGREGGRPRGPRRDGDRRRSDGEREVALNGQRSFDASHAGPQNFTAACMACGKETTVPADAGNRVIFCQDCYSKMSAMARA